MTCLPQPLGKRRASVAYRVDDGPRVCPRWLFDLAIPNFENLNRFCFRPWAPIPFNKRGNGI